MQIMASDGEFVVKKSAVDHFGLPAMHALNRFAEGGLIPLASLSHGRPDKLGAFAHAGYAKICRGRRSCGATQRWRGIQRML